MEQMNLEWLAETMDLVLEPREIQNVDIDTSLIYSGDFFGMTGLQGDNSLIMYGTGSRIGHCTMALWMDGELYIVESVGVFGIRKTPYEQWIQMMRDTRKMVIWLPLR